MSQHPISHAFESVDATPSPAFRRQLRGEFLAAIGQPDVLDAVAEGDTASVIEARRPPRRRLKVVLSVAASIALVAALTAVFINRRSEPNEIDTSRDPAIARSSLLAPKQIGVSWAISHQWDAFTSRKIANIAATVPACADYVDYAFDSPRRQAATAGRIFTSGQLFAVTQWVYIFPTEAAASRAMDKIAEAAFVPCFRQFMDALFRQLAGVPITTTTIAVPPLAKHGDRQVVLGQAIAPTDGGSTSNVMNAFVQVGRGIVYVNPTPNAIDSRDPASRLEKVLTAATEDLRAALAAEK